MRLVKGTGEKVTTGRSAQTESNMRRPDTILTLSLPTFLVLTTRPHVVSLERAYHEKETVILVATDGNSLAANSLTLPILTLSGNRVCDQRTSSTKTWPNHHSYLTGLYPESNGIASNKFWDPVYQEKYINDYDYSDSDPKFYNASEPIWLTLQKQGGRRGVYFWPGSRGYLENPRSARSLFAK